jgi:tetratricopeptide (TPR) repeat protein
MIFRRAYILAIPLLGLVICDPGAAASNDVLGCKSTDTYHSSLKAFEVCHRALQAEDLAKTDRAALLLWRAEAAYFLGQFGPSLIDLDESLILDPNLSGAHLRRAWARMRVNLYPEALEDISNVLSREPDNVDALFALGYFYADTVEWQTKSMPAYKQVLELNPSHFLTRLHLARMYSERLDMHEDAIVEYDKILAASDKELHRVRIFRAQGVPQPDLRGQVRLSRAEVLLRMDRHAEALAELDKLALAYPGIGDVFTVRAQLHNGLRKFKEAHADARLAVELEPDGLAQKEALVRALFGLGEFKQALSSADKFIAGPLDGLTRGRILFWRGYANKALGGQEEALQDFEASIAYDPFNLPALLTQLVQNDYYEGEVTDAYNERARNGLQACIIDPECGR